MSLSTCGAGLYTHAQPSHGMIGPGQAAATALDGKKGAGAAALAVTKGRGENVSMPCKDKCAACMPPHWAGRGIFAGGRQLANTSSSSHTHLSTTHSVSHAHSCTL